MRPGPSGLPCVVCGPRSFPGRAWRDHRRRRATRSRLPCLKKNAVDKPLIVLRTYPDVPDLKMTGKPLTLTELCSH
jgi:hypothetical protein